jgi:hypothetical protein
MRPNKSNIKIDYCLTIIIFIKLTSVYALKLIYQNMMILTALRTRTVVMIPTMNPGTENNNVFKESNVVN